MDQEAPPISEQRRFWDTWIDRSMSWESNDDNQRRAACVIAEARRVAANRPHLRIIDVGCGSGWATRQLCEFGDVTGTDLGEDTMDRLRLEERRVRWIAGDFIELDFPDPFDFVSCMETIAHVPDQVRFVRHLADVTAPGGTVVLTTQNPYVWTRRSWLQPPGTGQLRDWPDRGRLIDLFAPHFDIQKLTTCAPGSASRGLPHWLNNRVSKRAGSWLFGAERWTVARERAGMGCSLLLVGRKR